MVPLLSSPISQFQKSGQLSQQIVRIEKGNDNMKKNLFEEYLHSSDPEVRRRADNWGVGIGLQDVDGLSVSPYLIELAKLNIEGKITMDEVQARLDAYYKKREKTPATEN